MSSSIADSSGLIRRIFITLAILCVCRIGAYIPTPGIDADALSFFSNQHQNGLLGVFDMLSGGSLGRMSIFALAIMPYITASIVIQILSLTYKPLGALKQEGEVGRSKINYMTKYLTIFLSAIEAYAIASKLQLMNTEVGPVVIIPGLFFKISTVTTLVVGTIFLVWLGEQISAFGVGNGTSLIIFTGIVSAIPSSLVRSFELMRSGALSGAVLLFVFVLIVVMIFITVFFERAQRKIPVQYPKKQIGNKVYGGEVTHMPLKLNTSGVIPPIFASALLSFPVTVANFYSSSDGILGNIGIYFSHGRPLYVITYALLIVAMSFIYTAVVFDSQETANNLKKHGAYIPGRRPGNHTAEFFDYLLVRLNALGALYLVVICVVPELFMGKYSVTMMSLSGTSLVIVVNVVMETFSQIQSYMLTRRYESLMKKTKFRDR